jgi:hypothetical protein
MVIVVVRTIFRERHRGRLFYNTYGRRQTEP